MSIPFMWFDLATPDDGNQAADFYRQMFGWDVADAGIGGSRPWIGGGPQPWAGIVAAAPGTAGQWLPTSWSTTWTRRPTGHLPERHDRPGLNRRDGRDVGDHRRPGRGPARPVQNQPRQLDPLTGEELFWQLAEPLLADPAATRSTMMRLPCLRLDGRFFASLDRRTQALLVKLPADRVTALIAAGHAEPFAPAGRVFREWVALPLPDRRRWRTLLNEARRRAAHPQ